MGRFFAILFVGILFTGACYSQKILLLEKTTKFKRIRHFVGDQIAFRIGDGNFTVSGPIDYIGDSAIVVNGELCPLANISVVLNYKKYAVFRALSKAAFYAIPPMLLFTVLHRGINTREQPLLDRNSIQVVGVFGAIGVVLWPFKARKYKLKKNWQLRVIDVTPG